MPAFCFFASAQFPSIEIHLRRRNRHLLKQEDEVIIAVHVFRKGYISQLLQKKLYEEYGVALWTPVHKNQRIRQSDTWKQWMKRNRKVIETVFSILVDSYRITGIRANSVSEFEAALDGILLAYSLVVLGLVER